MTIAELIVFLVKIVAFIALVFGCIVALLWLDTVLLRSSRRLAARIVARQEGDGALRDTQPQVLRVRRLESVDVDEDGYDIPLVRHDDEARS